MPPLPLHQAGPYVAAAYIVFFALVLIYVAIMAVRLLRLERRLGELLQDAEPLPPAAPGQAAGQAAGPGLAGESSGRPAAVANGGQAGEQSGAMDVGRPEQTPV